MQNIESCSRGEPKTDQNKKIRRKVKKRKERQERRKMSEWQNSIWKVLKKKLQQPSVCHCWWNRFNDGAYAAFMDRWLVEGTVKKFVWPTIARNDPVSQFSPCGPSYAVPFSLFATSTIYDTRYTSHVNSHPIRTGKTVRDIGQCSTSRVVYTDRDKHTIEPCR